MKIPRYFLIIASFVMLLTMSAVSGVEQEIIGKANLSKNHSYVFLDTTFNGKFFYALYYISQEHKQTEPTVGCFREDAEGFYNCWYYQKLKTAPNRIIATSKLLICLNEMGGQIEIYNIKDDGSLLLNEQASIMNYKYDIIVKDNEALIVEK